MICRWCSKKYKEPVVDGKVTSCPHCEGCYPEGFGSKKVIDVPLKGSERWYKERWFRKDQKTWEADIKSRKALSANGEQVGRFNNKGERIG